jgi:hypothetical protein
MLAPRGLSRFGAISRVLVMRVRNIGIGLLALHGAVARAQASTTGSVSVGPSHLGSGFAARVTGSAGTGMTRLGLEVGFSGNGASKDHEEIIHAGLLLERRIVKWIPVDATGVLGGFGAVSGARSTHLCDDGVDEVTRVHCYGPSPVSFNWLSGVGVAYGLAATVPAGPVSLRVEVRRYATGIPTVDRFFLADVGIIFVRH